MLTSSSSLALLKLEKYDAGEDTNWMLAYIVVVGDVEDDVADGCYYSIFLVVVVLHRCQWR